MPDAGPRGRHRRPGRARLNVVLTCVLLAACSAALAAVAWARPKTGPSLLVYRQTGKLAYSAATTPTSVYGSTGLLTGEPVYLKVVSALRITYTYRMGVVAPRQLHGTEQLVAQVGNGQGVVRDLPLQPTAAFKGDAFATTATLRIATLQAIAASFGSVAGGSSSSYTVSIVPDVTIGGRAGAARFKTTFGSPTKFAFSSSSLTPGAPSATPAAVGVPPPKVLPGRPLTTSSSGQLRRPSRRPAVLGPGITVADARIASLASLAAALCAGILVGLPLLRRATSGRDHLGIAARLGSAFVEVDAPPGSPVLTIVELSTLDGLLRVGRQLDCPVLRLCTGAGDQYSVVDSGTMYRFGPGGRTTPEPGNTRSNGSAVHGAPGTDTYPLPS